MSMQRVNEAMRVHRLAALRGAKVAPICDGWSVSVAGREIEVKSMADAEHLLLAMPVQLPTTSADVIPLRHLTVCGREFGRL